MRLIQLAKGLEDLHSLLNKKAALLSRAAFLISFLANTSQNQTKDIACQCAKDGNERYIDGRFLFAHHAIEHQNGL